MPPPPPQDTRPDPPHRNSSSSVSFARSPHDGSLQRKRVTRFAVGQAGIGPRNTSHDKNMSKQSRSTAPRPAGAAETALSPKAGDHVKRNKSNIQLTRNVSATALRKNQSETSLKRNNRSNAHLAKLPRPGSSRGLNKTHKRGNNNKSQKADEMNIQMAEGLDNPTVRFNLSKAVDNGDEEDATDGDDDDGEGVWENYTDSRSPSTTRSSTPRRGSIIASPSKPDKAQKEADSKSPNVPNGDAAHHPPALTQSETLQPPNNSSNVQSHIATLPNGKQQQDQPAKPTEPNRITSRLLKRNVSFNAPPQISSNSATPVMIGNNDLTSSSNNTNDSNPEVVSRFLNNQSTSTTPHDSIFLPVSTKSSPEKDQHGRDEDEEDGPRRNRSMPDVAAMRISRTQQKLNLERESVFREPQQRSNPPLSILRASRFSSANIPFYEMTDGTVDGRLHPQMRHLFDQTRIEYRRVKMYQNPLVDAIGRLEDSGLVPRMRIASKQKPNKKGGLLSGSGDGAYGLSQSWRSHRSSKSGDAKDKTNESQVQTNGHVRKPRVMFQGVDHHNENHGDRRSSLDGQQDRDEKEAIKSQQDEAREICRRLWKKRLAVAGDE